MRDWLSYRLSDLLLFSPRTYYRMFELYHEAIWPAQLLVVAMAVAIIGLLWREDERGGVVIAAMLATSWLWVAVMFHLRSYASINWAARYFAALFVAEVVLVLWLGVVRRRLTFGRPGSAGRWSAAGLFTVAAVLTPLAGRAADRTWAQVELPGLTPDATAVATLALLLVTPRAPGVLLVAPLAWCVIGGATLWALESREAWVLIGAGIGTTVALAARRRTSAPGRRAPRTR